MLNKKQVTNSNHTERDYPRSEKQYYEIFNAFNDAVLIHPFQNEGFASFIEVNQKAVQIYGYTKDEFLKLTAQNILMEDFNLYGSKEVRSKLLLERSIVIETLHITKSGKIFPVEFHSSIIEFEGKKCILSVVKDISEKKYQSNLLADNFNSYKELFNTTSDTLYVLDKNFVFVDVNRSAQSMYGYTKDELIGKTPEFVSAPGQNNIKSVLALLERVLKTGQSEQFDFWGQRKNGDVFPKEVIANKLHYFHGDFLLVTARDVTERTLAIKVIEMERELFRGLFASLPVGVVVWDRNHKLIALNEYFTQITGYENTDIPDLTVWYEKAYPDDDYRKVVVDSWKNLSIKEEFRMHSYIVHTRNEDDIMAEFRVVLLGDGRIVSSITDVTERDRAHNELEKSKENYESLFKLLRSVSDNMPDMLWAKDLKNQYIFANQSICDKLLLAEDTNEPIGKADIYFAQRQHLLHSENPQWYTFGELCQDSDDVVLTTKKTGVFDEYGNVEGKFIFLQVYKSPLFNSDGHLIGTVGSARDVTFERNLFKQLEDSHQTMQAIFNTSPNAIFIFNMEGFVTECNDAAAYVFGYANKEDLIGLYYLTFFERNSLEFVNKKYDELLNVGLLKDIEFLFLKRDTTHFNGNISASLIKDNCGNVTAINCTIKDITERRLIEDQMKAAKNRAEESDRLKSAFLANMSHEIRTPMNGIVGFANLLNRKGLTDEKKQYYKKVIIDNSRQLLRLVNDILDISRIETNKTELKIGRVNINELLTDIYALFSNQIEKKDIQFSCCIPPQNETIIIMTDELRLKQVFANLINNAFRFTSKGFVRFGYEIQKSNLYFYVEDSGVGIAKDQQKKVFERFYQEEIELTQRKGGTGLGLSISERLIRLMGGDIGIESEKGTGSKFYFTLPYST